MEPVFQSADFLYLPYFKQINLLYSPMVQTAIHNRNVILHVTISPLSTTTNLHSTNQRTYQIYLSFATPGGSSSMKSFFGSVLARLLMSHAQIRPKHVFYEHNSVLFNGFEHIDFHIHNNQIPVYFAVHNLTQTCRVEDQSPVIKKGCY